MSVVFNQKGRCDICEQDVSFIARHEWFRDHLLCSNCGSIPRERALMRVIKQSYPHFANLRIHESSPAKRGVSVRLDRTCSDYSISQYFPQVALGQNDPATGHRCENLEALTFADNTFDIFVTQDVMEHVFNPEAAFKEIARVLRPGGAHIFTVPLVSKWSPTSLRASLGPDGQVIHHMEPQYHGNPIDDAGSLMTINWGYDIAAFITEKAKTPTIIMQIDDIESGIRAEFIEVVVSRKPR
ncbi:class I SAM-dependent methyltransferase [Hoeflea sp.]|uniref:class I SAM-dependent methyltransferase n=1 Tax=Hoeflea sp. TaxID=1940281 RepID=UPI0019A4BF4D|nr:class I SAM-dependent methyltransferase [Hoeflea sp.]MBC7284273.1 class I SAM-dependent methyltransferase [Hoeflea sp.]